MDTPHGGTTEERSSKLAKSPRYSSPFEPKFINRIPRSIASIARIDCGKSMGRMRKASFTPFANASNTASASAVFQPSFTRSLERAQHDPFATARGASGAQRLSAIHITICLPRPASAEPRPRAFGFGLRKARDPLFAIRGLRLIGLRDGAERAVPFVIERGATMRGPVIASLDNLTLEEALTYLDAAEGDELVAASELARDRNLLDGSTAVPDETEVHHALFMLRRARGLAAPSFDTMRVQLRRLQAA